jgi:hypothetical protein
VQPDGTTSQIVSSDLGRSAAQASQAETVLHQFVLRVVGPDGVESESYPLPGEALADLPAFLTNLGVPDGHYRVYLIAGDLERLVIDGHLRAGRIVDPNDGSPGPIDFTRGDVAGQFAADPGVGIDNVATAFKATVDHATIAAASQNECDQTDQVGVDLVPAATSEIAAISATTDHENNEHNTTLAMPMIGGAIAVGASATILCTTASHRSDQDRHFGRRFCKKARLARKLARHRPTPVHV